MPRLRAFLLSVLCLATLMSPLMKTSSVQALTWDRQVVSFGSPPEDYGRSSSLALDSIGVPHIGYVGVDYSGVSHVMYVKNDPSPFWSLEEVDTSEGWTSLALDSENRPHISYWNGSLCYAYGRAWQAWDLEVVDSHFVGPQNVIAVDSMDRPHIFYKAQFSMNYARWTGAAWDVTTVVYDHVDWISLAVDSEDRPHVSYYEGSWFGGSVWYSWYNGTDWLPELVDDSLGFSDGYTSIALDSMDRPHISYYDADSDLSTGLRYAKRNGATWTTQTVDSGNVGTHTSIALDCMDRPHISYYDYGLHDLKYARWTGSAWTTETVASGGDVGRWSSIAVDGATVHISYYDTTNQDLWYATSTIPGFDTDEYFYSVDYLPWDSNGDRSDDAITVQMDVDSTYPHPQKVYVWAFLRNLDGDVVDRDHQSWFIRGVEPEYGYCYLYVPPSSPAGLYHVLVVLYDNCDNLEDSDSSSNVALYPPAIISHGVKTWYWTGDTKIDSVAVGDVDGDGLNEIVTGGSYDDGTRFKPQLCVWSGSLNLENAKTWYWEEGTAIYSVALGDVDGDGQMEIVTGGSYDDGTRDVAQLCVWNGATLSLEGVKTWYWTDDTSIWSVAVADVDGDGQTEIVTGGGYWDGTRTVAQLCVWDGSTLSLEGVRTWYWVDRTPILAVAAADVDGDLAVEVVTGGFYWDGTRNVAQLCVWDGSTLNLEAVKTWHWTSHTAINSVACADVDGDGLNEIVTGGRCDDATRNRAQLCVWSGSLDLEGLKTWYWTSNTDVFSVAVGDVVGHDQLEIVTGGYHYDLTRWLAQLCVWDGSTLSLEGVRTWYWTHSTHINSVAVADVDGDGLNEIVTGGRYHDGTRGVAQLCVWGL